MKTRTVEYFRLWDDHTWDTDFIDIPTDTPDDRLEKAVREAAEKLEWDGDIPLLVGFYHAGEDEDEEKEELTAEQRVAVAKAMGYQPDEATITNAIAEYEGEDTANLQTALHEKETEFQGQGGRGVELAEEIDHLRMVLALAPRGSPEPREEQNERLPP